MANYFVFTDEAGAYQSHPSEGFIKSHPFYIRANVMISIDDYRKYQLQMQRINGMYEIPFDEEIKWSDLGTKYKKGKPRSKTIAAMSADRLKGYYRTVLQTATANSSISFLYTVTDVVGRTCRIGEEYIYEDHLQDAFQRVQMDLDRTENFATFIMDELNEGTVKQIKAACHEFTVRGDFVRYKNLYQGVLTESSLYSPGIQLADYAAGIMNGYLHRNILSPDNYQFATDLYNDYIKPKLRHHAIGIVCGYGVIDIPKRTGFRPQIEKIFDPKE